MAPWTSTALLALLCAGLVAAEVVLFQSCPEPEEGEEGGEGASRPRHCAVHEVRVDPCAEAAESKPCKIKRGTRAAITFDFTPEFALQTATTRAFWAHSMGDLPFVGMDTDACAYTQCPATAGTRATLAYNLEISKKFPLRGYDVKWRLWNDTADVECCFIIKIKLSK